MSDQVGNQQHYLYPVLDEARDSSLELDQSLHPTDQTAVAPSVNLSSQIYSRRRALAERRSNIQYIPGSLCPRRECLTTANFILSNGDTVIYRHVLLSKRYFHSYIWEETFRALGFEPSLARTQRSLNPRSGDFFDPIGISALSVQLDGQHNGWDLIWFYILPGSPAQAGVNFIVGKPDIERIYGRGWTAQQHVEAMSTAAHWVNTL
ncbi:hypothetical protein VTK26DRAFT_5985 [Humicola hyalothermophila]